MTTTTPLLTWGLVALLLLTCLLGMWFLAQAHADRRRTRRRPARSLPFEETMNNLQRTDSALRAITRAAQADHAALERLERLRLEALVRGRRD